MNRRGFLSSLGSAVAVATISALPVPALTAGLEPYAPLPLLSVDDILREAYRVLHANSYLLLQANRYYDPAFAQGKRGDVMRVRLPNRYR